jgi:hypothetical protein
VDNHRLQYQLQYRRVMGLAGVCVWHGVGLSRRRRLRVRQRTAALARGCVPDSWRRPDQASGDGMDASSRGGDRVYDARLDRASGGFATAA